MCSGPVKLAIVDHKKALAAQLSRWADLPSLKRILVSHGAPIEQRSEGGLESPRGVVGLERNPVICERTRNFG